MNKLHIKLDQDVDKEIDNYEDDDTGGKEIVKAVSLIG